MLLFIFTYIVASNTVKSFVFILHRFHRHGNFLILCTLLLVAYVAVITKKRLDSIYRIQSDLDLCISFPEGFLTRNYMAIASPYVNEPKKELPVRVIV